MYFRKYVHTGSQAVGHMCPRVQIKRQCVPLSTQIYLYGDANGKTFANVCSPSRRVKKKQVIKEKPHGNGEKNNVYVGINLKKEALSVANIWPGKRMRMRIKPPLFPFFFVNHFLLFMPFPMLQTSFIAMFERNVCMEWAANSICDILKFKQQKGQISNFQQISLCVYGLFRKQLFKGMCFISH